MNRNVVGELNRMAPAANHALLGTLLQKIITAITAFLLLPIKVSLGSPAAAVADALIKAATGAELPNNETKTYTGATDNTSPLDGSIAAPTSLLMADGAAHLVWVLDVARNIVAAVTHDTSVVAMTILVSGFDVNKNPISELLTVTATGTTKTVAGKKAFKYILSYAIVSAGDATTNTLNLGFGNVLGLPYKLVEKSDLLQTWFNQVQEATAPTVEVADTGAVSTTSGDPRGTVDLNSAPDGSSVRVWMRPGDDYTALKIEPLSEG